MELTFDAQGFGTPRRRIAWSDLRAVGIRTTGAGPFAEDLFWCFVLPQGLIEVPGAEIGGDALRVLQEQLRGFDDDAVIRAMTSVDDRMFFVWSSDAPRVSWDEAASRARFVELVRRLGGEAAKAPETFARLVQAWSGPERRYHDLRHLAECLRQLELAQGIEGANLDVAELALWLHDAVYLPTARGNEEASALLLLEECGRLGVPAETAETAAALVRSTSYGQRAGDSSVTGAVVRDVDLSILGADPVRFLEYEHAIEEEFASIPTLRFRIGRGRFLSALLARPEIFETPLFRERFEARARENVAALLQRPRYRAFRLLRWVPGLR